MNSLASYSLMSLAVSMELLSGLHLHASTLEIHSAFRSLAIFMLIVLQPVQLLEQDLPRFCIITSKDSLVILAKQVMASFQKKPQTTRLQRKNGNEKSLD